MTSLEIPVPEAARQPPAPPPTPPEPVNVTARRQRLRTTRRRATGLLVAATLGFIALQLWGGDGTTFGYVEAGVEAAMVGALADWFAVTALFRHPLGLPIPHTAIIPTRKDQFGETLGDFVQTSFLTPEAIVERVHAARVVPRMATWLAQPPNAERLARHLADASVTVADLLRDDEVHRALEDAARHRIETTPLAPVAGRMLKLLTQVAEDPDHELRRDVDARVRRLVDDLQTSPEMLARGEELKAELLSQPELRQWVAKVWADINGGLAGLLIHAVGQAL